MNGFKEVDSSSETPTIDREERIDRWLDSHGIYSGDPACKMESYWDEKRRCVNLSQSQ